MYKMNCSNTAEQSNLWAWFLKIYNFFRYYAESTLVISLSLYSNPGTKVMCIFSFFSWMKQKLLSESKVTQLWCGRAGTLSRLTDGKTWGALGPQDTRKGAFPHGETAPQGFPVGIEVALWAHRKLRKLGKLGRGMGQISEGHKEVQASKCKISHRDEM